MRKRWLCLCVLLVICGCSDEGEQRKTKDDDFLYFLYAAPLEDHPIWLQSKEGFDQACEELKVKCDWIGPKIIDAKRMNEVVSQGIVEKADGIITQGVISKELLAKAAEANIPVTLVDSNIEDEEKFAYYGKNFHTQAELFLKEIEKSVGEDEKLVIAIQVAELEFKIAQDQISKIEEVFQQHPGGYEVRSISESKSDKVRAQSEWLNALRTDPDINITINFAAESAEACGEIAEMLKVKDQVHIYGVDDMDTTIDYIRKGFIDASVVTSFYEYGYQTVYQMYDYKVHGKKSDSIDNEVKLIMVNADNADTYKSELK